MNIDVHGDRISITPVGAGEEKYVERVLGLRKEGDTCVCRRVDTEAFSDSSIRRIEIIAPTIKKLTDDEIEKIATDFAEKAIKEGDYGEIIKDDVRFVYAACGNEAKVEIHRIKKDTPTKVYCYNDKLIKIQEETLPQETPSPLLHEWGVKNFPKLYESMGGSKGRKAGHTARAPKENVDINE